MGWLLRVFLRQPVRPNSVRTVGLWKVGIEYLNFHQGQRNRQALIATEGNLHSAQLLKMHDCQ